MIEAAKVVECLEELLEQSSSLSRSSVKKTVDSLTGHTVLEIYPMEHHAAAIKVRVAETKVILFFGKGAVFEIPEEGKRYTRFDLCGEVRALCSAVMKGAFEETVFFRDDQVVGARARVFVATDDIAHETWNQLSFKVLFGKREAKHFTYVPYETKTETGGAATNL